MMATEQRPTIILPYHGTSPTFHAPVHCGPRSAILGRTTIGRDLVLGARAILRGDGNFIRVGDAFCLGAGSTVHISRKFPTIIGNRVTVGANAVVHACEVGDDVVIEDDVVILDGSVIAGNTIIAKGSIVFPRSRLEAGDLWSGLPARRQRALEADEVAVAAQKIRDAALREVAPMPSGIFGAGQLRDCLFAASSARIVGEVVATEATSIWFGCEIDAGESRVTVGERTNVQDNCVITCPDGPVTIGRDCVIGHNVRLESCTIGEGCLIGNGAFVRAGTIVEPGLLLAAGAITEPGQRLTSDSVWGSRPARRLSELGEARRQQTASTLKHYLTYAADYRALQA